VHPCAPIDGLLALLSFVYEDRVYIRREREWAAVPLIGGALRKRWPAPIGCLDVAMCPGGGMALDAAASVVLSVLTASCGQERERERRREREGRRESEQGGRAEEERWAAAERERESRAAAGGGTVRRAAAFAGRKRGAELREGARTGRERKQGR
jgi:hypothetical protein